MKMELVLMKEIMSKHLNGMKNQLNKKIVMHKIELVINMVKEWGKIMLKHLIVMKKQLVMHIIDLDTYMKMAEGLKKMLKKDLNAIKKQQKLETNLPNVMLDIFMKMAKGLKKI